MNSAELRDEFLKFFAARGHQVVPSSPLVPANDPTLLFTNAGMVQFKDVFLGRERRENLRAASSQRCVRAGGKHNDLENVGYTARHHTFFEMLGNFSFGDYFKRQAIEYAWELVTGRLGIAPERLWVTVYEKDDEAASIWLDQIGVDPQRFRRMGEQSNFWAMGDSGPCGPCSEIFYDHGSHLPGGPPGALDEDGDRYVEIWNLVFMQFDRSADGTMQPLPKPSVDTGMGLERMAAVMQGVHSNYDIDLFVKLIDAAAALAGTDDRSQSSLRVIADHIRACSFLVVDGVLPSNEGRGYVLRRIIRRAIRHGYQLGIDEPFFHRLVKPLEAQMGRAYPELSRGRGHVEKVLKQEEERFAETLAQGMRLLDSAIADLSGRELPGETVFRLYDTYGFPVDLTADIARERGLRVDQDGFEQAMRAQRERARAASRFGPVAGGAVELEGETGFTGYDTLRGEGRVTALLRESDRVEGFAEGDVGVIVLDSTPFYAEGGGQVGDTGTLSADGVEFEVRDTRRLGASHGHFGVVRRGRIAVGDRLTAQVDAERRAATVLNHSATHLLHAALRALLGSHVTQKGSLVAPDRLRFDFSHYVPVSEPELAAIERLVNDWIRANTPSEARLMGYAAAIEAGALALFGEKYAEEVRVMRIGDVSTELCGGTHVQRSGDIGLFKIIAETGVAAGVRRIEALTGAGALAWVDQNDAVLRDLAAVLKTGREDLPDKVRQLVERARKLEKDIERLQQRLAAGSGTDLSEGAERIDGINVVARRVDGLDAKALRAAVDQLKSRLGSAAIVLGSALGEDKVLLIAGVTKDQTTRLSAGDLVNAVAEQVGGRGGGRADLAQAGGSDPSRLDAALDSVPRLVRARLG